MHKTNNTHVNNNNTTNNTHKTNNTHTCWIGLKLIIHIHAGLDIKLIIHIHAGYLIIQLIIHIKLIIHIHAGLDLTCTDSNNPQIMIHIFIYRYSSASRTEFITELEGIMTGLTSYKTYALGDMNVKFF